MSARDRFREAEKQSMKAYNRRPAVTPPTNIVLENEAEPLSIGKGLVEAPWGGSPYPKSRTSAAIREDEISRTADLATIATADEERRRKNLFNESRDRVASATRKLPTDLQGISELFGDTEMGFDFLRRSNFSDKMQAGLRDKRPMSEYISYENIRPSGEYQRDSNYQASSPSEALSMQTPETFGNTGVIRIEERMTPKKQEEVLYHEFLHKGDISRRQKVDGLIPGSSSSFGPFGVADHKAIAAESNRAFSDSYNRNDMRTEMIHNVSAGYLDRSERNQIAQKAIDAIAAERGLGENLFKSDLQNKKEMDDLVLTVHDAMGSPMSESAFIRMADIKGLSDAEVRTVFNQFNDFMADSVSEREADKNRNVDMLKAAENFSAGFAKGGIISALMEGK